MKLLCYLFRHVYHYDDTRGWHGEPLDGAVCIRCREVYREAVTEW